MIKKQEHVPISFESSKWIQQQYKNCGNLVTNKMKNIIFLFSACILASSSLCAQICLPPAINYPAGSGPSSVTTADFNGDGKLDLASANSLGNNVSVLFGNGSGSFASATNYAVGTNPQSITAGDFNGDGFIDLITGNLNSPFLSFLRNTSQGYFLPALQIQSTMTWSIDSADFNGDGFLDIVTAGLLGASVLISDGAGNFSTPAYFQVGTDPRFVSCGDF
ncbi:MAG: hypothetical protein RL040_1294, partial [Bacteroidota bacterium]